MWNAKRVLHIAAYEPAESNDGVNIWRGHDLTEHATTQVDNGIAACSNH